MNLRGVNIVASVFQRPGHATLLGRDIIVRHESELLLAWAGASWHPFGDTCPTATNEDDCRCMLGEEA